MVMKTILASLLLLGGCCNPISDVTVLTPPKNIITKMPMGKLPTKEEFKRMSKDEQLTELFIFTTISVGNTQKHWEQVDALYDWIDRMESEK